MRDEDLRSQTDYSEGQKKAAHRVLIEIVNILNEYQDDILVIGGWVPDLLFPGNEHIGSIDIDILINHLKLEEASYNTIDRILKKNGYIDHPEKYFSYVKTVEIDDVKYDVDVDILAGIYGGSSDKKRSQRVQGLTALKATGGNFAFEIPSTKVTIEAQRPDGAIDTGRINVISIVAFLVMKVAALGRGKPKDAYDIYFCIKHYPGGASKLALEFENFRHHQLIIDMVQKLREKFASTEHSGPFDIISFLELFNGEEIEIIKRDVFEQVDHLIKYINPEM